MFGLDARIALAIFGALSVITGAALYSAIQKSKVTAFITQSNEIQKAYEQFYLDTAVPMTIDMTNSAPAGQKARYKIIELLNDSSIFGWHGPYISNSSAGDYGLVNNNFGNIVIYKAKQADWTSFGRDDILCGATDTCMNWIVFHEVPGDTLKALEKEIDGTKNPAESDFSGNFRYMTSVNDGGILTSLSFK